MTVIRAFVAVEMSPEIHDGLDLVTGDLKQKLKNLPIRWVPVENMHLTLKFFGDVSEANLEVLKEILKSTISGHHCFEISVGELGAFPSMRRPRVVWVNVEAPPELSAVQRGIETETTRLGYAREKRAFAPHLTLGRVSRTARSKDKHQISEVLEKYKVGFLGVMRVQSVNLYRSDLRPSGAVYTRLFSASLRL